MAKKKNSSSYSRGNASVDNAATTLLANIRFASMDNPIRTVVITSSIPNEGKSTVSASLARAMAASGKRVLLVDCDTRNRSLAGSFNVHPSNGLFSVLSKQVNLDEAATPLDVAGLFLVDIEPNIPNPADIFASKRFQAFLDQAGSEYDYVVLDTPPIEHFIDAAVIASHVDATVLVVRENFSRRESVAHACDQLRKADANLIGVCMNCCSREAGGYSYGYSAYGYGSYGSSESGRSGGYVPTPQQINDKHRSTADPYSGGTRFKR